MHPNIQHLLSIAAKPTRRIIGLMSGTSLDGLDVAVCDFSGSGHDTNVELVAFETVAYDATFKAEVQKVFSKKQVDLEKLCLLHPYIGLKHAAIIKQCLEKWNMQPSDIDLIGSHGQTIFHAPKFLHKQDAYGNATLQIGDGDHLSVATGIITLSDFRQKHIAAGGEGAPLAVYGDYFIFSKKGEDRIMLNIGGIANFTYLPGSLDAAAVFSTDTGTGNTLMDALVQQKFPGKYLDEDAALALKGSVSQSLLEALKDHPFFAQGFPKTIGPELFNLAYLEQAQQKSNTTALPVEDVLATLNRFSADMIVEALQRTMKEKKEFSIYVSGGGMHNPLLMKNIKEQLTGCTFYTTADLHVNPDAKEAVLFALLANESICGGNVSLGMGRDKIPNVAMGKISFPY